MASSSRVAADCVWGLCVQPGVASALCAILQKSPNGVSLRLRPVMDGLVGQTFQYAR